MSRRIFVNTLNDNYQLITNNKKGGRFGLGVPTSLSNEEQISLGLRGNEIFFTTNDLLEKKRKIQIIFDSFTDPKFFGDGSVNITKVQQYITELELEASRVGVTTTNSIIEGTGILAGITGVNAGAIGTIATVANAGRLGALGVTYGLAAASFVGLAGLGISAVFSGIKSVRQAGREDNAAPWKMTRTDFPRLTAQAIQGSPSRRSIERLYDDRSGFGGKNRSVKYSIARLTREALADALFSAVPSGGTVSLALPEHPLNEDKEALAQPRHFPFRDVTEGPDQTERTYVNAVLYLKSYIDLIDAIINLRNQTLSRSPDKDQVQKILQLEVKLSTANVPLFTALTETARQVIREKTLTFFDENREYKTLLNFGDDRQYVAEAWRLAPSNTGSLQLKLLKPLDTDVDVNTTAFISREIAQSVIDVIDFELAPLVDNTPYLRPFNMDSKNFVDSKMFATNATLSTLGLSTGSAGTIINNSTISYDDTVFRRWFTGDFKSSELNVDFTDYNNFVHFGSAYKRLEAFTEKLLKVEELTSASISSSVSSSTISIRLKAQEKERIIRTFDPYEQFLYYATGSIPYTASAYYTTNEVEYNPIAYWPKQPDGTPYSPNSSTATSWLTTQTGIAQRYDDNNPNYLVTNLPSHIREDVDSEDFTTFVSMVGHIFDNIKVYADQFPNIYATSLDPLKDLSMDQAYEVAQSFGLQLPNVYALENLQTFNAQFTGETGSRAYAAETWKRFLHSLVYFAKTKGTRTSFDALLNTYGIGSPVLQIKETTYPTAGNYIRSDELTYGLEFTGSAANFITAPLVSSSLSGSTIQLSFNPTLRQSSSLITANGWAIDLIPHPSASKVEYGRIHVVSGSGRTIIATSSYFPLFSDDYTNLMLRSQSGDISIIQTDGDQILFQQSASISWGSLWNNSTLIYIGGSGSIKLSSNFDGIIDEIRVWGENISTEDFVAQAYDPGSYYAATYTSSYDNLYVHVPFSQPLSSITASVFNESPYKNVSIVQTLPAQGFTTASYTRILRSIKQFVPIVGSTVYTNRKVTVAPAPVFNEQFVDGNGTKRLSRLESIKTVEEKQYTSGQNIVSFAISPTDFVNQNIIRSMGVVDVNNLIGSPRYVTGSGYAPLQQIEEDYVKYFNKTINPNEYTRFFKDLVEGPGEAAETMVPARAKLLDGIVIESPVISRQKSNVVRTIAVDGSATKKFNRYVAGSGSIGIGAYSFELGESINIPPTTGGDTLPITATIVVPDDVVPKSTTKSNKMPSFRRVLQKIGDDFVTASIMDENSSYDTLEAPSIDMSTRGDVTSSGYPRNPYVGIPASGSVPKRFNSENNTLTPFYNIPPRADLSEVGTTTYFHKSNGKYSYDIYTLYKQEYLVKLDTKTDSPLDRLYAPITLLPSNSIVGEYGRNITTIPVTAYTSGSQSYGLIKVANVFSLYGIEGASGLRIRMYRTVTDQQADKPRSFNTIPSINSGVLFDGLLQGLRDVFPYVMMQALDSTIYYTIDNTTSSTITTPIVLHYFAYEPDNLIPIGYLPRHYKFSRDNTTALKRRNYLGCRDINRTFDDQSPFVVTISTQNTVVVNTSTAAAPAGTGTVQIPTQTDTIRFGGGGRLNVE